MLRSVTFCVVLFWMAGRARGAQPDAYISVRAARADHIHFSAGATNAEYRAQLLALTPLGSRYEQVKLFARSELASEWRSSESFFDPGIVAHRYSPREIEFVTRLRTVWPGFSDYRRKLLNGQPPHAKIKLTRIGFTEGVRDMLVPFTARPSFLNSWIELRVYFVFDAKQRLIDLYCDVNGRHMVGP